MNAETITHEENRTVVDAVRNMELAIEEARQVGHFMAAFWLQMPDGTLKLHRTTWQFSPDQLLSAINHLRDDCVELNRRNFVPAMAEPLPTANLHELKAAAEGMKQATEFEKQAAILPQSIMAPPPTADDVPIIADDNGDEKNG
jgi:hypothetical protein